MPNGVVAPIGETFLPGPYEPYVHPDTPGAVHFSLIDPLFRVNNPDKGDPLADYRSHPEVRWGMAAVELAQKAVDAHNSGSSDADALFQRAESARQRAIQLGCLWWLVD